MRYASSRRKCCRLLVVCMSSNGMAMPICWRRANRHSSCSTKLRVTRLVAIQMQTVALMPTWSRVMRLCHEVAYGIFFLVTAGAATDGGLALALHGFDADGTGSGKRQPDR